MGKWDSAIAGTNSQPEEQAKAETPKDEEKASDAAEEKKPEPEDSKKEDPKDQPDESKDKEEPEGKKSDESKDKTDEDPKVPQKVLGQVVKRIREKSKSELAQAQQQIEALKAENEKLRGGVQDEQDDPVEKELIDKGKTAAQIEWANRQDEYGRKKYGDEVYGNAVELIKSQNDPVLVRKVWESATPADTLVQEAMRIAEELQYGEDPGERDKNKKATLREQLKKEIRAEIEAENAEKLKARGNQTTDVGAIRSGGGTETSSGSRRKTWGDLIP